MIVHLTTTAEWAQACERGTIAPPSLTSEGFVHLSTTAQIESVANAFYSHVDDAIIVEVDEARLTDLRWEPPAHPDGRAPEPDAPLFPHHYGPIPIEATTTSYRWNRDAAGIYHWPPERP